MVVFHAPEGADIITSFPSIISEADFCHDLSPVPESAELPLPGAIEPADEAQVREYCLFVPLFSQVRPSSSLPVSGW